MSLPSSSPLRLRPAMAWLRQRALTRSLLIALLSLASLWLFADLADEVLEGGEFALDRALLLALRNPEDLADPIGPWWFDIVMTDLTALGGSTVLTLVWAVTTTHLLVLRKWGTALLVTVSI